MQVKVIFRTSPKLQQMLRTANKVPPPYLAYVEWFTPLQQPANARHKLFQIRRYIRNGTRWASIIPLHNIRRSIQLIPRYGKSKPAEWNSKNVLDMCNSFYVNSYSDRHAYYTIR